MNSQSCDSILSLSLSVFQEPGFALTLDSNLIFTGQNLSGYNWYRNNQLLAAATSDTLDALLFGNGTYYLVARNANGCIVYSDTLLVNLNFSLEENNPLRQLALYPNPATNHIALTGFISKAPVACSIYSTRGEMFLQTEMATDEQLFVGHLAAGVYLVKIVQNDYATLLRLVIAR
jgi:hypothetical protein